MILIKSFRIGKRLLSLAAGHATGDAGAASATVVPSVGGDPAAFAVGKLLSPTMPPGTGLGGLLLEAQTGVMRFAIAKNTGAYILLLLLTARLLELNWITQ